MNKRSVAFIGIIIVTIILMLMVSFYEFKILKKDYITYKDEELVENYESVLEQENANDKIVQTFKAEKSNLNMIQLNFDSLKDEANMEEEIVVGIIDSENNTVIAEDIIKNNVIRETQQYYFRFDVQKDSEGKTYDIYIYGKNNEQNAKNTFRLKYSNNVSNENSELRFNDEKIEGELSYIDYYKNQNKTLFFYLTAIIISIIVLILSVCIYKQKNITVEKAFLLSVPVICILFLIFMPAFKSHDELYHWYRIYDISEGHLLAKSADEVGFTAAHIPKNAIGILEDYDWTKLRYSDVVKLLSNELDSENTDYTDISTSAVYSPVQYLPQVIGVLVTKVFTDVPIIIAYGARVFNLLFSLIILYFAIKLMPFGKKGLLIPAFIPIAIEGFTSMSPDAMTISVCFLYIAYIFNITFNEKRSVKKRDAIFITIFSVLIALCKIVYLPLVGLVLIIPKKKFKTKKSKIINTTLIIGVSVILNLVWLYIASKYLSSFRGGDSKLQVMYILTHPFEYIKVLLYTINNNGYNYFESLFGGQLGWGELIKLKFIIPFILFMLYSITSIIDNGIKERFNLFQKLIITLIILAISVLIFTSLYVQWTYVGNDTILGVQGRYFLPFIPLIFILLGSVIKVKSFYNDGEVIKVVTIMGTILQIYVILSLVIAHI